MNLILTGSTDSYAQFITVLLLFVIVLAVTALTTKWIANYQKQQGVGANVQVVETERISNGKYIQIVRIGEKYVAIAVCKDTVTMLGEIPEEQLKITGTAQGFSFKQFLAKAVNKSGETPAEPKENQLHDEE